MKRLFVSLFKLQTSVEIFIIIVYILIYKRLFYAFCVAFKSLFILTENSLQNFMTKGTLIWILTPIVCCIEEYIYNKDTYKRILRLISILK